MFEAKRGHRVDLIGYPASLSTTGNSTVIRVPLPIVLRMLHFPPSSLARCRMPSRPKWSPALSSCQTRRPNPESRSELDLSVAEGLTRTFSLLLCWQAFVRASWAMR